MNENSDNTDTTHFNLYNEMQQELGGQLLVPLQ